MNSDSDKYIMDIVNKHTPVVSDVAQKIQGLLPHVYAWANGHKYEVKLSGSLAKGTGITGTTDVDLFISLDPSVSSCNTLENVYTTLRNRLSGVGYTTREQNVSLGINHCGLKMDIVPGVKHHALGFDHSLWKRKAQTWTKTNIDEHISHISTSGRTADIRAIKIWRKLRNMDFPSFFLELSVIEALRGNSLTSNPSGNFKKVMDYLSTDFITRTIKDPSNSANNISDDLTQQEKLVIKTTATQTLQGTWEEAIW
jgi:hypothetical protein